MKKLSKVGFVAALFTLCLAAPRVANAGTTHMRTGYGSETACRAAQRSYTSSWSKIVQPCKYTTYAAWKWFFIWEEIGRVAPEPEPTPDDQSVIPADPESADDGVASTSAETDLVTRKATLLDDGTEAESVTPGWDALSVTASFWSSCKVDKFITVRVSDGAAVRAYSDSCRRRNGTWTGPLGWAGVCRTDIKNCNGLLRCGGC